MVVFNWIYNLLVSLISPFAGAVFLVTPRGRGRWCERFGIWQTPSRARDETVLWLHGASVGEVNGLLPIIQQLKASHKDLKLMLTSTSVTGLQRAERLVDFSRLLPFDVQGFYQRAFNGFRIRALVISETELWPGLLQYCKRRAIPVLLVNARLSERSSKRYRLVPWLMCWMFSQCKFIGAGSVSDEQRIRALGAEAKNLSLIGNTKYDQRPSLDTQEMREALRAKIFGGDRCPVLVLGSLRPGEEAFWFPALKKLLDSGARLRVLCAPRHSEKFSFYASQLSDFGISFERYSELREPMRAPVLLVDALGVLESLYSLATVAFIGATLVEIGGHNPLEAAAYGVTPVLGPYVSNINEVVGELEKHDACLRISSAEDVESLLRNLVDGADFSARGRTAHAVWLNLSGATQRYCQIIGEYLA